MIISHLRFFVNFYVFLFENFEKLLTLTNGCYIICLQCFENKHCYTMFVYFELRNSVLNIKKIF